MRPAVIIPTLNEALGIRGAVERAAEIGDVYVVDSGSSDETATIATAAGAEVVRYVWDGRYPKKKQWCLEHVGLENDWVLFLDADESVTSTLKAEIAKLTPPPDVSAYRTQLDYEWQGRQLRFGYRVEKTALLHRPSCRYPEVDDLKATGMGEQEGHYQPSVDGKTLTLSGRLYHRDEDPFSTWLARHNRYSDWQAYVDTHPHAYQSVSSVKSRQGRLFSRVRFRVILFFLYAYVYKLGFLDGRAGLDYAVANCFYYWMIDLKRREIRR